MRHKLVAASVLVACFAAGCSGPAVQQLTGKVTFKNQPVPAGRVFFLPDPTKKNTGPGGFAEIKNGKYDTRAKGAGSPSGALIVRIDGFDGQTTSENPLGQPLFLTHEMLIDLAPGTATHDFDVPADAAKNLPKAGRADPP